MSAQVEIIERPARIYQDYSADRKAEVLALIEANNGNVLQTSRETGIPHQTIRLWLAEPDRYSSLRNQKQTDLAQKLENNAYRLADSIAEHDLTDVPLGQKATAMGIVIDKMQLLRGQPTSITVDINSHDLADILQGALSELTGNIIDVTPENQQD